MNKTITVLVTAYNEEKNIVNTLDKIFIYILDRKKFSKKAHRIITKFKIVND